MGQQHSILENNDLCGVVFLDLDWITIQSLAFVSKELRVLSKKFQKSKKFVQSSFASSINDFTTFISPKGHLHIFGFRNLEGEEPKPVVVNNVKVCSQGFCGVAFIRDNGRAYFIDSVDKEIELDYPEDNLIGIACASNRVTVLTDDGKVFYTSSVGSPKWERVGTLNNIIQIASGKIHHVALSRTGEVWGWGCNDDGALGSGSLDPIGQLPVKANLDMLNEGEQVALVVAGGYHNILVTNQARSLSYGYGAQGQLGNKSVENSCSIPEVVNCLEDVRIIGAACTFGSTCWLTDEGRVWVAGWGSGGRLGLGNNSENQSTPIEIPDLYGVRSILCGSSHIVVLLKNGEIWGWGESSSGQLGELLQKRTLNIPEKLQFTLPESSVHYHWRGFPTFI